MERLSPNILPRDFYQYVLKTQQVRKPYRLMLKFNKYAIFSQCASFVFIQRKSRKIFSRFNTSILMMGTALYTIKQPEKNYHQLLLYLDNSLSHPLKTHGRRKSFQTLWGFLPRISKTGPTQDSAGVTK